MFRPSPTAHFRLRHQILSSSMDVHQQFQILNSHRLFEKRIMRVSHFSIESPSDGRSGKTTTASQWRLVFSISIGTTAFLCLLGTLICIGLGLFVLNLFLGRRMEDGVWFAGRSWASLFKGVVVSSILRWLVKLGSG